MLTNGQATGGHQQRLHLRQTSVPRPLEELVLLIKNDFEQAEVAAERAAQPYYKAAGEKLIEAKAQVKRGKWGEWLGKNFNKSERQARAYMSFARATSSKQNGAGAPFSSLREKRRIEEEQRRADRRKETFARWREEYAAKQPPEREAERELALRLIDTGYRALSKELHPDAGGSNESQARLNKVRARLRASA